MVLNSNLLSSQGEKFSELYCSSLPNIAKISLCQDKYTIMKSVVSLNETVKEGQVLAIDEETLSSVHSPVPGTVCAFETLPMPDGKLVECICIQLSGEFEFTGKKMEQSNWQMFPPSQRIQKIAERGIVNTFNLLKPKNLSLMVKQAKNDSIQNIFVRLFDDDMSYYTDGFISDKFFPQVVEGARLIADTIGAKNVVFFTPENFILPSDEISGLDKFKSIKASFVPVKTKYYPAGTKHDLLTLANKKLGITVDSDFFIDSCTLYNVYNAIALRTPSIDRIIHVSGDVIKSNREVRVRIGTPVSAIIAECGGFTEDIEKVIINGLINGTAIADLNTPVTKYVKSIKVVSKRGFPIQKNNECIRCGQCSAVCPQKLHPENVVFNVPSPKLLEQCTNCGLCNAVCASRIPLSQIIKIMKEEQNAF